MSPSPPFAAPLSEYARPSVTVDVVIFSLSLEEHDLRVLLISRESDPFAHYFALPGGFIQIDESLETAASRQLLAKTGVNHVYMEQLYTFGKVNRDPRARVLTVAYFALVPFSSIQDVILAENRASWHSLFRLPAMAFDHAEIVQYAYQRLRYKLEYTTVGFQLLPDQFTLTALQRAYEIILQESIDKRNFRRKILSADILEETGDKTADGEGRPAKLYRYREDAVAEVKTRRLFP